LIDLAWNAPIDKCNSTITEQKTKCFPELSCNYV